MARPNLVYVFADQMRAEATGYAGHPMVKTPHLDRLAARGLNFENAIAGTPVCCPWRACLLTGQYPLTHGIFMNDLQLPMDRPTLGTVLKENGYRTGYIGKWHLDGANRSGFTPPGPRRQGFDFWAVGNCTHDYMNSLYFRDDPTPRYWNGYDAIAQTDLALEFLAQEEETPFALVLSYGPPHNPYDQVPQRYLDLYPPDIVPVRPNCPEPNRGELRGYYAHITALDEQVGRLVDDLEARGEFENTIFVFTSDHGDMLGSHGQRRKQRPWEESIHVPMVLRAPNQFGAGEKVSTLINGWDMMPTLLGLLGIEIPKTVEGLDLSAAVRGESFEEPDATLCALPVPFSEYQGEAWRAVRTKRHTYVRRQSGPWLLHDNIEDPFQMDNLVGRLEYANLQERLEAELKQQLKRFGDTFETPECYREQWGYTNLGKGGEIKIEHRLGEE